MVEVKGQGILQCRIGLLIFFKSIGGYRTVKLDEVSHSRDLAAKA
jgi:hypothetical protein